MTKPLTTEQKADLLQVTTAFFRPDGTLYKWAAGDPCWKAYRKLAHPSAIRSLLDELAAKDAQLNEQEAQMLELADKVGRQSIAIARFANMLCDVVDDREGGVWPEEGPQDPVYLVWRAMADFMVSDKMPADEPRKQSAAPAPACTGCGACEKGGVDNA